MVRNETAKFPVLLVGYDVEAIWSKEDTTKFLKVAPKLHAELEVPCTFFICGKIIEEHTDEFQDVKIKYSKWIDFQQHTYSHILLKTVVMKTEKGIEISKGATLEQIRDEVNKTNEILKKVLGEDCIGITGPYCYYRGLSDRPDILEILHESGLRFTRTYGRNEHDYQPVPFEIQPFWYEPQGFGDILECPIQGWQDVYLRNKYGYKNIDGYLEHIKKDIERIIKNNLVWGYVQHDWSSILEDPNMYITREFLEYAKKMGVNIMSYKDYYMLKKAEKIYGCR